MVNGLAVPAPDDSRQKRIVERSLLDLAERLKNCLSFERAERMILENLATMHPDFPENLAREIVGKVYAKKRSKRFSRGLSNERSSTL